MDELGQKGVKFTEEDVVMVARTQNNNLAWLEKGNQTRDLSTL